MAFGKADFGKPELKGDAPEGTAWARGTVDLATKPVLIANANRHELDDTQISVRLERPWSQDDLAELSGHGLLETDGT